MRSNWFRREEFACKCGCEFDTVDTDLLDVLEDIREYFDAPITINSGCRCETHNKAEGGSEHSMHLIGQAVDIIVYGVTAERVHDYLITKYPNSKGIGKYNGRTHIDVRSNKARWDNT